MTTTLLVPTDFSEAARNAGIYAAGLAKEMNYNVLLYHVYTMPVIVSSEMTGPLMLDMAQLEKESKKLLKEEAGLIGMRSGVHIDHELSEGMVVDEIVSCQKKYRPGMIVMGMKAAGPLSEFMLGSTVTDLFGKIDTPLLIVPEKAAFKKIERLVFTDDHKVESGPAMSAVVREILQKNNASVFILNVLKENDKTAPEVMKKRSLESYFEDVFHSYYQIENDDVIEGINEFIDRHHVNVVTMIPHRHNFFARLFSEGHAKKLAFHTHAPVLVLPEI